MGRLLCILLLVVALPRIARADEPPTTQTATQPTSQPVTQIEKWFDELADTEPAVRERARMELLGLSRSQLPALREIVQKSDPLAPAQAAALRDIVVHVYLAGEPVVTDEVHGFMGVMLSDRLAGTLIIPDDGNEGKEVVGVPVQECMQGYCGFRYLRPGDMIVGIGEGDAFVPTPDKETLIEGISRNPPGSQVTLRVLRQGQLMSVWFALNGRPAVATESLDKVLMWRQEREQQAEEYWQNSFIPVVGPGVS